MPSCTRVPIGATPMWKLPQYCSSVRANPSWLAPSMSSASFCPPIRGAGAAQHRLYPCAKHPSSRHFYDWDM